MKIIITENQLKKIVEMSIPAHQGSSHDFSSFDINKVGSGEGSQWFGWGLYFTDSEDIADYYAKSVTDMKNKELESKSELKYKGNNMDINRFEQEIVGNVKPSLVKNMLSHIVYDLYKKILSSLQGIIRWEDIPYIGKKDIMINYIKKQIDNAIEYEEKRIGTDENSFLHKELRSKLEYQKRSYESFLNGNEYEYNKIIDTIVNFKREDFGLSSDDRLQKQGYVYNVTLHKGKTPEQYDYLSWYNELTPSQKQKIINQIKTEKLKKRNFYIVKPINNETEIQPKFFAYANDAKEYVKRRNLKNQIMGMGIIFGELETVKGTFTMDDLNNTVKDFYIQLCGLLGSAKEASMFLLRAGIDGIKYPSNSLVGGESDGMNYVVFDQNQVTIDKKNVKDL